MSSQPVDELRILVADDDPTFTDAVTEAIDGVGRPATAVGVTTSDELFERTRQQQLDFDGILVGDRLLTPGDGLERLVDGTSVPVVFLTAGVGDEAVIDAAMRAGATTYFPRETTAPQYEAVLNTVAAHTEADGSSPPTAAGGQPPTESSREASREVFENVADGLVVHDPDTGEIVDVNQRFCEMHGRDRAALVGSHIGTVTPPDAAYSYESATERVEAAADGDPQLFEWRNQRADGETFPVEVHLAVMDSHGDGRVLASVRDISERRQREREYEQIFNMAGDGVVIHDLESGEVVDANQQVAELLGYDRAAFLDRPLSEFQATGEGVSGDDAREQVLESARQGGQAFEWPLETAAGETVWVRARHEIGEIGGEQRIVAILDDITERKRREREYEAIFHGVNDSITIHDPETAETLEVNDTFCSLLGYDREEILDMGIEGFSPTEQGYTTDQARAFVREVREADEPQKTEWAVETADGETRWLEVKGTTVEIGGELRHVSMNRDVTERREHEQRLQVFNRVLRHNLRNHLDVIKSHAEVLADETDSAHPSRIIDSADRLAMLGNRARDIDRYMSREATASAVDLAATIREVVESLSGPARAVAVDLAVPETAPVVTDSEIVEIILESAVENAIQYAESTVEVSLASTPDGYEISIDDDGPGISAAELAPLDAESETDLQHSRGLGLWQLKWGVKKLNGSLDFDTASGTTVEVTVPDGQPRTQ